MARRSSVVLSALAALVVGVLLMPRPSGANDPPPMDAGTTPPPQNPQTCGIGGKDATPKGTKCDDHNKCTTGDACDGDGKCVGQPVVCPTLPCSTGACNPATGACVSTNKADGTPCFGGSCKGGVCVLLHKVP